MMFSDTKSFVAGDRVERRLAAILMADVASYSRLMHANEEATHARVTALLLHTVLPVIAEHGGRVIKNTGDGFLAEFASAVDAVRAAMQFQDSVYRLAVGRRGRPAHSVSRRHQSRRRHRGDRRRSMGDGVNIAARLEGVAEPGGDLPVRVRLRSGK